jgi:hypothetical protein
MAKMHSNRYTKAPHYKQLAHDIHALLEGALKSTS